MRITINKRKTFPLRDYLLVKNVTLTYQHWYTDSITRAATFFIFASIPTLNYLLNTRY